MPRKVTKHPAKRRIKPVPFWPTKFTIDLNVHNDTEVMTLLRQILGQGAKIMAKVDDLLAILVRVDTATTNIAADITAIKGQIGTGMSDADVARVQTALESAAARLEALDAENPDGQPPTP